MLRHVPTEAPERPIKRQRVYTDQEKSDALAVLEMEQGNVWATSKKLGIPYMTLNDWANAGERRVQPIGTPQTRETAKRDLAAALDRSRWAYLDRLNDPEAIEKTSGYYAAVTFKILNESHALVTGGATSRVELSLASFLGSVGALPPGGGVETNADGGVGVVEVLPSSPTSTPT